MPQKMQDAFVGAVLLSAGLVWCVLVWRTIPPGTGGGDVGPRAFPLLLGALLSILSAVMIIKAFTGTPAVEADLPIDDAEPEDSSTGGSVGWLTVFLTFAHMIAYAFLMQKLGFLLSTVVVVASIMVTCAGERSPLRIVGMSVGVAVMCWLIFGKLLGVYLANGTWINLG
ncbi:tripartite tricarboxylate transporter TctB family protein [Pararhizobium haloflavum]|uniref:tripartite tricarboxylate transporter TctB family protein n=1 Tax=Pararhizobium haloflavum TaxID=2037914 RepID=UPI0012FFDAA4|nr:tripartite tricarboxylate transporter TctB family protein [Pararhizobium haloflavum]